MKDDVRPPQVSFICVVVLRTNRDWVVAWIIPKAVVEDRPLNAAITTLIILALCQGRAPIAPELVDGDLSPRAMLRAGVPLQARAQTARAYVISSGDCCVSLARLARHGYFTRLNESIELSHGG